MREKKMREKLKRFTVYFLIIAFLLSTVLSAIYGCGENPEKSAVAEVFGEKIYEKDIEEFLKLVYLFMPSSQETYSREEYRKFLKEEILWYLIENKVIEHEVNKLGLFVDEEKVEQYFLQAREELVRDIYGSEENYVARIKELGISEEAIKNFHRSSLFTEALYEYAGRDVTEEEARKYVEENPHFLEKPARVYAFHILLDDREKAQEVMELLKEGADFMETGQKYSLDNHVELGMISAKDMFDPAFLEAAFALEPGEISAPVETVYGYHLIKITEKEEQGVFAFEEIKEEIISKLKSESFQRYFQKIMEEAEIETYGS